MKIMEILQRKRIEREREKSADDWMEHLHHLVIRILGIDDAITMHAVLGARFLLNFSPLLLINTDDECTTVRTRLHKNCIFSGGVMFCFLLLMNSEICVEIIYGCTPFLLFHLHFAMQSKQQLAKIHSHCAWLIAPRCRRCHRFCGSVE